MWRSDDMIHLWRKKRRHTHFPEEITLGRWLMLARFSDFTLGTAERPPLKVGKVEVMQDLNSMTIGQLMQLSQLSGQDTLQGVCRILLGMDERTLLGCRATEVLIFVAWVMGEVQRINGLFAKLKVEHTQQEIRAGFDSIDNGAFGMIDWYARRMGYHDHEEAQKTPWIVVYKCMKIDHDFYIANKRLQEIQLNDIKHRK